MLASAPPGAFAASHPDSPFTTYSLALAAYLEALGYRAELRPNETTGRCLFTFPPTAELRRALAAYQSGSAKVEPGIYESVRNGLLTRIAAIRGGAR